jgi:hypothetical protein
MSELNGLACIALRTVKGKAVKTVSQWIGNGLRLLMSGLFILEASGNLPAFAQELVMQDPPLLKARVEMDQPERKLIIDAETRMIGGAIDRSTAYDKQLPAQKFPFFIAPIRHKQQPYPAPLTLTIGSIRGINTPEAHATGQSQAGFVSSPAVIKINGQRIGYIYTDGEAIQMTVPSETLRPDGFNVLQVEAGFYFLPGNRVAYDELEVQHLALLY